MGQKYIFFLVKIPILNINKSADFKIFAKKVFMKKNEDNTYPELMSPGPIFKKFFILSNKNKITNDYYFDPNNVVFFSC